MSDSTDQLLDRLAAGDKNALDELLTQHLNALHGYLRLKCGSDVRRHESSMDLVQSVCRELLAEAPKFENRGAAAFRRWLFQVAEHKVRDRARFWKRERRDDAREEIRVDNDAAALSCYATFCTPSQVAIAREELDRIEAAFDELEPQHREVILLSRVVGLSNEEIALRLERSPHSTRTLLSRALARLTTQLDR